VTNNPPTFTSAVINQTMTAGSTLIYPFPGIADAEGHPTTINFYYMGTTILPNWIVPNGTHLQFSPPGTMPTGVTEMQFLVTDHI
jgi:hypothetical protein